jgi:hypothetical protein
LEEARYWKDILHKICKIGFEFEMNLPECNGTCKGDSYICPCSHPEKETRKCYEKCHVSDSCTIKNKIECPGIYCVEFVSPCQTCQEAVKNCQACAFYENPDKLPGNVRKKLTDILTPSNDLSVVGKTGTMAVTHDGSLLGDGGVEVTTVGRRVNFDSFYRQAKEIIDKCKERGAFLNERTSVHMHLVAGYFNMVVSNGAIKVHYTKTKEDSSYQIKELERPVPEIILANFHQLVRRYHNAITWLASSGDAAKHITRWAKFRIPIIKYSAIRTSMQKIVNQIAEHDGHSGKYSYINYSNIKFSGDANTIEKFHIEARYADGMHSPTAIASLGVLLHTILMKAVSMSKYGVLQSGDPVYMDQAYEINNALLNNAGNWDGARWSNTENFEPYRETVREQAHELVNLLYDELKNHGSVINVLHALADNPCSMRLISGNSWEAIEEDLAKQINSVGEFEKKILQHIDMYSISECNDGAEWATALGEDLSVAPEKISAGVEKLIKNNLVLWDPIIGSYVRC